ncbi:hypothetical protein RA263_27700, partial [Pseudomonas syringae pv. tagetis]
MVVLVGLVGVLFGVVVVFWGVVVVFGVFVWVFWGFVLFVFGGVGGFGWVVCFCCFVFLLFFGWCWLLLVGLWFVWMGVFFIFFASSEIYTRSVLSW